MYLLYCDESGDSGLVNSPTDYFIVAGLVVHELRWLDCLNQLIAFRRRMHQMHGLRLREEIHAAAFIRNPGAVGRIPKGRRLAIIRGFVDEIARLPEASVYGVVVDKRTKTAPCDVFDMGWKTFIQRFENTMQHENFNGPARSHQQERGILVPDNTENVRLKQLLRRMRRYNPVPSKTSAGYRNLPLKHVIEDPNFRESSDTYFVQAADTIAYVIQQQLKPCKYMQLKGGRHFYRRLQPVHCEAVAGPGSQGLVHR